jgi:hypothetical protein
MSSHKSGSATASENVAKRPRKSITLEENIEVIRRMEGGNHVDYTTSTPDSNTPPLFSYK